jgi:hypothetical protein
MPTARMSLASSVADNKIYCIGGWDSSKLNINEEYDPSTNSWSTKVSIPEAGGGLNSSVVNNKIYCMGGSDDNEVYGVNKEYTLSKNILGYVNKNNKISLNIPCKVNGQVVPANTKTKITSNGYIKVETSNPITGYIQL